MEIMNLAHPRTYERSDGETGTEWIRCGKLFIFDNGYRVNLTALPTDPAWDGTLRAFPQDNERKQANGERAGYRPKTVTASSEDIPF